MSPHREAGSRALAVAIAWVVYGTTHGMVRGEWQEPGARSALPRSRSRSPRAITGEVADVDNLHLHILRLWAGLRRVPGHH